MISFWLIVLLKFILLFHIFKVRDANVLSFPSPNIWGRLFFVFGGLFFCTGPVYKSHNGWNWSNCLSSRTWCGEYWRSMWRYFFTIKDSYHIIIDKRGCAVLFYHPLGISTISPIFAEQRLHLFLTSNNSKNLEDAKKLAEDLMDTISKEFGVSR